VVAARPESDRLRYDTGRLQAAVVYGVVPPLFGSPPLQAVADALPELEDLGVDVLWLSPIFEAPDDDYGYAVTDYSTVRRTYGKSDDLRRLVEEAHRRRMRVLLDFVPNHTSSKHPYFVDAEARGRASPYFAFYARDAADRPTHYFDWSWLPNLDYGREDVRRWMIDTTTRRIRDSQVDGFRMDVAWGVRQRAPGLWARWTGEIRRAAPGAILIAEASARDPSFLEEGFDAAYDWTEQVGTWAWQGLFDEPESLPGRVWNDVRAGPAGRTLRFLNNNDTGERFVSRHGPGMTRVASAMMLTIPGVPCLFTGDERGAEYDPYGTHAPLDAGSYPELRAWYRSLIALRHAHPSLYRGDMLPVAAEGAPHVFAYARRDGASGEVVLVALNFDAQPAHPILALPGELSGHARLDPMLGEGSWETRHGLLRADLPGWGVLLARMEPP
jgi:glycosidase